MDNKHNKKGGLSSFSDKNCPETTPNQPNIPHRGIIGGPLTPTLLITGASGFIGSFIVEEALRRGFETWAAVRKSSSRRYLQDSRIHFIELDMADPDRLERQLRGHKFDYVVHAAGLTKSLDKADFFRVNTLCTVNLAETLMKVDAGMKKFVFVSSLSVLGPVREEQPYKEMTADDEPHPDTAYGQSKIEGERLLDGIEGLPCVTLRPTGVYGPREKDYFMMAKSIKGHVDFAVGYKPQDLTFIYVEDVVQAVFLALDHGRNGAKYLLSDGNVYPSRAFSDLIRQELGNPWLLRIKAPLWFLRIVTSVGEHFGRLTGRITALNNDKYNIMKQRNWRCDITPAMAELGYKPRYTLADGVKITIKWYKDNGWI